LSEFLVSGGRPEASKIVPVVIAVGEWKEHGFVVQAGRRMAYKEF
jgi:hypothetical protein